MIKLPFSDSPDEDLPELPEPDVEFATGGMEATDFTEAEIKGILMNPAYTGFGEFPALVSEKQWVSACKKIMENDTPEQFLVNLLFLLRSMLGYVGEAEEQ